MPNAVVLPAGQAGMSSNDTAFWGPVLSKTGPSLDLGNIHSIGASDTFFGPAYRQWLDQWGYQNKPFWITEALAIKLAPPRQALPTDDQQARSIFTGYATDFVSGATVVFNIGATGGGQSGGSSVAAENSFDLMAQTLGNFKTVESLTPTSVCFVLPDGSSVYVLWNGATLPASVTGTLKVITYGGDVSQQAANTISGSVPVMVIVPAG